MIGVSARGERAAEGSGCSALPIRGEEVVRSMPSMAMGAKSFGSATVCRCTPRRCDVDGRVSKCELAGCVTTSASSSNQQNLRGSVGSIGGLGQFANSHRFVSEKFRSSRFQRMKVERQKEAS